MEGKDFISGLEKFFLDLAGTMLPGICLVYLAFFLLNTDPILSGVKLFPITDPAAWLAVSLGGYILGHLLTGIGELIVVPFVSHNLIRGHLSVLIGEVETRDEILSKHRASQTFTLFRLNASKFFGLPDDSLIDNNKMNLNRGLAIEIASGNNDVYLRFTTLSLINLGAATLCFIALLAWPIMIFGHSQNFIATVRPFDGATYAVFVASFIVFIRRYFRLYQISQVIPFSMATVKIRRELNSNTAP